MWNAREEAPAEEYKFFVDSLMGTIRCVPDPLARRVYWLICSCLGMKLLAAKKRHTKVCQ